MSKVKIKCNHCGLIIEWYLSMIDEIGFTKVDDKLYCDTCLNRLAHVGVDAR